VKQAPETWRVDAENGILELLRQGPDRPGLNRWRANVASERYRLRLIQSEGVNRGIKQKRRP
jgi:hypothetical protein